MPSLKTCSIVALVVAALVYFSSKKTLISVKFTSHIGSNVDTVFNFLRNPDNLPKVHPFMRAVEIKEGPTVEANQERSHLLVIEQVPVVGSISFPVTWIVNTKRLTIVFEIEVMRGVLHGRGEWTMMAKPEEEGVTVFSEETQYYCPWILSWSVTQWQLTESQYQQMLNTCLRLCSIVYISTCIAMTRQR